MGQILGLLERENRLEFSKLIYLETYQLRKFQPIFSFQQAEDLALSAQIFNHHLSSSQKRKIKKERQVEN